MPSFSKIPLSTTSIGAGILLTSSGLPGIKIHETQNNGTDLDELWLYANNTGSSDSILSLSWGATGTSSVIGPVNVQAYAGPTLISPGLILQGSGSSSSVVYGTSSVPSGINIYGYINRITN